MPTVTLASAELFKRLGKTFTQSEFEDLCFEFGIELDEVTTEKEQAQRMLKEAKNAEEMLADAREEEVYKIEVPANRYDLLCMEGMCQALNVFLERSSIPNYHYLKPKKTEKMIVTPATGQVRPFVVCAILRNLTLDDRSYESLLEVQKKLHQGVCRERKLVAIGTHDLDTLQGPFTYEALPAKDIRFAPLRSPDREMTAAEMMECFDKEEGYKDLKPYLHLIRDQPVYPVIYDANRTVLSLPPIINGEHSKVSKNTKNMFIECTATDLTKAEIVLNTLVAAFSEYSSDQYSVERVDIVYPDDRAGKTTVSTPNLQTYSMRATVEQINQGIGNLPEKLTAKTIQHLLGRMMLDTKVAGMLSSSHLEVHVPITRSDILHPCDIVEDVAIAYGFNKIPARMPNVITNAKQFPINKLSDMVRREMAQAGYYEILTMSLLRRVENFDQLQIEDDGSCVTIANPATLDFQVCRTTLLPGMLKTLAENTDTKKPLRLFECSDVVLLDESTDTGARNQRRVVAVYQGNKTAGFEHVHGLLDRLMLVLNVPSTDYKLIPSDIPTFFPKMQARVEVRGTDVGQIGVLHPVTLTNFIPNKSLVCPASSLEINLEFFL